jgi:hypothetical protein
MPDPTDVAGMAIMHFVALEAEKEAMRDRNFHHGFRVGLAAVLLDEGATSASEPLYDINRYGLAQRFLAAEPGLIARSHNRGLYAGIRFGQSLTSEQAVALIESGFEGLKAEQYNIYTGGGPGTAGYVYAFARALKPAVDQIFAEAAREAAEREAERMDRLFQQQREDPKLNPWRVAPKF